MAKNKNKGDEMSFLDHLEELRWLLVRSFTAILIGGCVAFYFSGFIFDNIIFAPKSSDFITYRFFCDLANQYDLDKSFCVTNIPFELISRDMEGQLNTDIWTSITAGLIMVFPYILYLVWKFISPALYEKERKMAVWFILTTSVLFFMGVLFGYYLIMPLSINFLANYKVSEVVENMIDVDSYMSLIKTTVIACGLVFEMPIIIYFLAKLGLVSAAFLRKYRRYALVIILIIAAIVTPPDVISQTIVTIPLVILYEASILIAARIDRIRAKQLTATP
jgi:sec-independent protein translocase protein TatC